MKNYTYEDVKKLLKFCGGYHLTEAEVSSILQRPAVTESVARRETDELTEIHKRLLGTPVK